MSPDFHHAHRQALALTCQRLAQFIKNLGLPSGHLEEQAKAIADDRLRILVLGEFKRGKSTLINALLKEDLLPHQATPATPLPMRLHFAQTQSLQVKDRQGQLKDLAFQSLSTFRLQSADIGKDRFEDLEEVFIGLPNAFLAPGIEIIDSPGLHEDSLRSARTEAALLKADALIIVLDATQLLSWSEQDFLEKLQSFSSDSLFFIINRYDVFLQSIPLSEQAEQQTQLSNRLESILDKLWPEIKPRIFFISALEALKAAKQGREDKNFSSFSLSLENFLQQSRLSLRKNRLTRFFQEEKAAFERYWQQRYKLNQLNLQDYLKQEENLRQQIRRLEAQQNHLQQRLQQQKQQWRLFLENEKIYLEDQWLNLIQQAIEQGLAEKTFTVKILSEKPLLKVLPDGESRLKTLAEQWQKERLAPQLENSRQDLKSYLNQEIALYKQIVDFDEADTIHTLHTPAATENLAISLQADALAARHFLYGLPLVSGAGIWLLGLSSFSLPAALVASLVSFFLERHLRWQKIRKELSTWLQPVAKQLSKNFIDDQHVFILEKLKRWQTPLQHLAAHMTQESARLAHLLSSTKKERQYNQEQALVSAQKHQEQQRQGKDLFQVLSDLLENWQLETNKENLQEETDLIRRFCQQLPALWPHLNAPLRSQAQQLTEQIEDWQKDNTVAFWCFGNDKSSLCQFLLRTPLLLPQELLGFAGLLHFSPGKNWQFLVFHEENLKHHQEATKDTAATILRKHLNIAQPSAGYRYQFIVPGLFYQVYDCPKAFNVKHPLWSYFTRQAWRARILYNIDAFEAPWGDFYDFYPLVDSNNLAERWLWWSSQPLHAKKEEDLEKLLGVKRPVQVLPAKLALLKQLLQFKQDWRAFLINDPFSSLTVLPGLQTNWLHFFWKSWVNFRLQGLATEEFLSKWQEKANIFERQDQEQLQSNLLLLEASLSPLLKVLKNQQLDSLE